MLTGIFDALGLTGWTRIAVNVAIIYVCAVTAFLIMWHRLMELNRRG